MDEITELAGLRADVPAPSAEVLSTTRARLAELQSSPTYLAARPPAYIPPLRRRRRRRVLIGIAAALAVTVGAVSFVDLGLGRSGGSGTPVAGGHGAGTTATAWKPPTLPALHLVSAASVLDTTADRTLKYGDPVPGPGQYLYTREHDLSVTQLESPPNHGAYEFSENTDQLWIPRSLSGITYDRSVNDISVHYPTAAQHAFAAAAPGGIPKRNMEWDVHIGSSDAIQVYPAPDSPPIVGCVQKSGRITSTCPAAGISPWEGGTRASYAELPTDPTALRASLYAWARGINHEATRYGKVTTVDSLALTQIGAVLDSNLAPATLRAALYRVVRTIPGITLTGRLANYDGVRGIAVGLVDPWGVRHELIFDSHGAGYIGQQSVVTRPSLQYELKAGTVIAWTAVTRSVAGKPTLPPGSKLPS